ncbi:MAG TPA: class I SAM-dependent methyltransferase [Bryobacteraceae bacterium]|jgi:2-polyprenyl-3-methyl-5-hydroxy-6-metoxy-1,4-benzoquinol methylase
MNLYDEVEYPSRSFSQTHPERAATIGTMLGMSPPVPATSRILEAGCGSGWNLIPMAAAMPDARLFGFDLAESPIESARRDTAALGLKNLRFEALDVLDFPSDTGEFDYIIAHGFYSWVPRHARLKLLEICRAHLSPQGLAFISFNANPYSTVRLMWRGMLLYHAQQMGVKSPQELIAQSETFLKTLRDQWEKRPTTRFHSKLLDLQIDSVRSGGGNWFFHDDLATFFEPFSVTDFDRELESYGLQFASEALFEGLMPQAVADRPMNWIQREQTWDNLNFRGFRSTLVCHRNRDLVRPPDLNVFEKLRFAAPLTRTKLNTFRNEWTGSEAQSEDRRILDILTRLAQTWPASVSFAELGAEASNLLDLTLANVIEPCVSANRLPHPKQTFTLSDKPAIFAPARMQAQRINVVTNRLHSSIQLEQEPLRKFVVGLDGMTPLSELVPLFGNEREMFEQLDWLYRAALI